MKLLSVAVIRKMAAIVIYRPLYDAPDLAPAMYYVRPIELFFDTVEYNGTQLPTSSKSPTLNLIAKLTVIRDQFTNKT